MSSAGRDEAAPLMTPTAREGEAADEDAASAPPPLPPPSAPLEGRSILDDLGAEVVGITAPVSACMAMTVALVRLLDPGGDRGGPTVGWASAAYSEDPSDSDATKFWGALANAAVFVAGVAAITFGLVAAFRRGWTRAIYGYLAWSGFSLLFFLGGDIALQVLAALAIPVDALTFGLGLWNFGVAGVAALFLLPASPLAARQAYCIATGVGTAYIFCHVPPWTTWALLGAMAAYDLYAVLAPTGPLKALVDLAAERGEDIPALIYEGRSTAGPGRGGGGRGGGGGGSGGGGARRPRSGDELGAVPPRPASQQGLPLGVVGVGMADRAPPAQPRPPGSGSGGGDGGSPAASTPSARPLSALLPDAIKLGLGDFIFYSVLVGRASMGDLLEAGAAYLGVVAGLGATLAALALRGHALPALPVSIALGAACTAAARWVVEPVVMPLATSMLYV